MTKNNGLNEWMVNREIPDRALVYIIPPHQAQLECGRVDKYVLRDTFHYKRYLYLTHLPETRFHHNIHFKYQIRQKKKKKLYS